VLITPLEVGQAQGPDLSWPPQGWNATGHGGGDVGFIINDKFSLESSISVGTPGERPICTSVSDPACAVPTEKHGWWIMRAAAHPGRIRALKCGDDRRAPGLNSFPLSVGRLSEPSLITGRSRIVRG
jgi:hypothetical protein